MPDYRPLNYYEHFHDTVTWIGYYELPRRFGPPVFHTPHYSSNCKYDPCSNSMSTNPNVTKKKSLSSEIFCEYLAPYHWKTTDWSICHLDLIQLTATFATPEKKVKNAICTDGAPPHAGRQVTEHLDRYPPCWIGRFGPRTWPARSPSYTHLNYCWW